MPRTAEEGHLSHTRGGGGGQKLLFKDVLKRQSHMKGAGIPHNTWEKKEVHSRQRQVARTAEEDHLSYRPAVPTRIPTRV